MSVPRPNSLPANPKFQPRGPEHAAREKKAGERLGTRRPSVGRARTGRFRLRAIPPAGMGSSRSPRFTRAKQRDFTLAAVPTSSPTWLDSRTFRPAGLVRSPRIGRSDDVSVDEEVLVQPGSPDQLFAGQFSGSFLKARIVVVRVNQSFVLERDRPTIRSCPVSAYDVRIRDPLNPQPLDPHRPRRCSRCSPEMPSTQRRQKRRPGQKMTGRLLQGCMACSNES